jgi:prophage antirepressor-like protein
MDFFEFNGIKITVILNQEGEPWWIAREVCNVLGLANVAMAVKSLDDDEKNSIILNDLNGRGTKKRIIINEPGLYNLIGKSTKPEAKVFGRWIRQDVLPSIRKTGSYSIQRKIEAPKYTKRRSNTFLFKSRKTRNLSLKIPTGREDHPHRFMP